MMIRKKPAKKTDVEQIAVKITEWIGTPISIAVHTVLFVLAFVVYFLGVSFETVLLLLTTIVSLEAIYLSLFIQFSVNVTKESLEDVEEGLEDIQEDVEGLEGGLGDIQEDVEGLEGNVRKMRRNKCAPGLPLNPKEKPPLTSKNSHYYKTSKRISRKTLI